MYVYYKVYYSDNPRSRGTTYKLIHATSSEHARNIFMDMYPNKYITNIVKH